MRLPLLALLLALLPAAGSALACAECERATPNPQGLEKCVREPGCCEANSETVNCFVDPCLNFETRCPRAARCVPIYCSVKPCGRLLYDRALNVLNESACSAPTPRPKRASKKLDLEIPRWHKPEQSERPTDCPRAQMSEIIKPCVAECGRDSDCPARRKCCWNGCARRCSRPLIRDPTNYLNLPLLSNDD